MLYGRKAEVSLVDYFLERSLTDVQSGIDIGEGAVEGGGGWLGGGGGWLGGGGRGTGRQVGRYPLEAAPRALALSMFTLFLRIQCSQGSQLGDISSTCLGVFLGVDISRLFILAILFYSFPIAY